MPIANLFPPKNMEVSGLVKILCKRNRIFLNANQFLSLEDEIIDHEKYK